MAAASGAHDIFLYLYHSKSNKNIIAALIQVSGIYWQ